MEIVEESFTQLSNEEKKGKNHRREKIKLKIDISKALTKIGKVIRQVTETRHTCTHSTAEEINRVVIYQPGFTRIKCSVRPLMGRLITKLPI